jgi:quinol---cytochrome c reductase iron-sulfur subunit, bacillus type
MAASAGHRQGENSDCGHLRMRSRLPFGPSSTHYPREIASRMMTKDNGAPLSPERRQFLTKATAIVCGGVATLVPVGAGLLTVLDPLRQTGGGEAAAFLRVTTVGSLPDDGTPRRFEIIADQVDAWNRFPNVAIGAVYLRKTGANKVEALNVTCPHAGCPVEFKAGVRNFLCPCHDSRFNLDGSLVAGARSPSPRALDGLEVEIREGSEVWVKFQSFEAGKATKVPVA